MGLYLVGLDLTELQFIAPLIACFCSVKLKWG